MPTAEAGLDSPFLAEWRARGPGAARSLARAREMACRLGLDGALRGKPVIGVVGSKGKGTAAVYAAATLAAAGFAVGTVTGPGTTGGRDRIRVDGAVIGRETYAGLGRRVARAAAELGPVRPGDGYLSPSGLFLLGGAAHLAGRCDALVLEAGIGGASDELSLLPLDFLMVTEIFAEHRELLGPTVADIARDKLGAAGPATRAVYHLRQGGAVDGLVARRCLALGARPRPVDPDAWPGGSAPPPAGYSRRNAALGITAGMEIARDAGRDFGDGAALGATLASVRLPGRLERHDKDGNSVIVDAAIERRGLVAALEFARRELDGAAGGAPAGGLDVIAASIPRDKDYPGFCAELGRLKARPAPPRLVFVEMRRTHLRWPDPTDGPWDERIDESGLPGLLRRGFVLAVGTALFAGAVTALVAEPGESLFRVARRIS